MCNRLFPPVLCLLIGSIAAAQLAAQVPTDDLPQPEETEVWTPVPPVVVSASVPDDPPAPPSDAVVLFDGKDLGQWVNVKDGAPAAWRVEDGTIVVDKKIGSIRTKRKFVNYQLHVEWRVPVDITGSGQVRGNSGVFLGSLDSSTPGDAGYELQILDSYENETYANGQAGSIYKQSPPLVNAMHRPGEWNAYDVIWTAPVFDGNGVLGSPAAVTVFHNGVLVQDHFVLKGETVYRGQPDYRAHGALPISLQAHHDPSPPISFRNIWVRELP